MPSGTPLPSLRDLFPSKRSDIHVHLQGLTSFVDLIKPRDDDQKTTSRPITPQLVLDRVNPYGTPTEQDFPTTPVTPAYHRRESDLDHRPPPSEGSSSVEAEDCHDNKTRKHVCHRCGKRFNRPSSLTIHHHTHTGERREHYQFPFHSLG